MATPESIETAELSSAPNLPETSPACEFTSARSMTVSYGQRGALLRLQGDWFRKSGFVIGTPVTVYVSRGLLVVQALSNPVFGSNEVHDARVPLEESHRTSATESSEVSLHADNPQHGQDSTQTSVHESVR
jgi:hypothetical protein